MATTQTVRRDFPASARRLRRPARDRAAGSRAVYDQEAQPIARGAGRVASQDAVRVPRPANPDLLGARGPATPDPVHARRSATADPARVRRPLYDVVARWLAICSLALVTLIAALIILT
ncbi:MAG: hypothetical protein ACTHNK_19525 [Thermomicrobiales bacterium]